MMIFYLVIPLLLQVDFTHGAGCEAKCSDKPVFSPPHLVVRFNDSASASCKVCEHDCVNQVMSLEHSEGTKTRNGTTISWRDDSLTEWGFSLQCFYEDTAGEQCCVELPVTVYQPPDDVSLILLNHSLLMLEGSVYTLECIVHNVAPVRDVEVALFRGLKELGVQQFINNTNHKPATETYTFNFTASQEDDGKDFWCSTSMKLGPGGPRPPPMVKSEKMTANVHYKPRREASHSNLQRIAVHEGETLQLNCSAVGKPVPVYSWTLPSNTPHPNKSLSVLTISPVAAEHAGKYTCNVSNRMGELTVDFHVHVQVDHTIYIVLGALLGVLLLICVAVIIYKKYYSVNKTGRYDFMKVSCLR